MTLAIGTAAPNAAAALPDGSTFHVADARGKPLVLFFYPKDFTAGCTREVCTFRDALGDLAGFGGTRVVGVSRDDVETHRKFIAKHRLPYDLLADPDGVMVAAFRTQHLGGLLPGSKRVTYVIDAEGVIRGVFHHEIRIDAHVGDVKRCLAQITGARDSSP